MATVSTESVADGNELGPVTHLSSLYSSILANPAEVYITPTGAK